MGGECSSMGERRITYKITVTKPEGKTPLGIPRHRWDDNIRIDLREKWWEGVDWTHLAQDRDPWQTLVNTEMNLRAP